MRRYGGQPLRGRGYEISLSAHCRGRPPCLPVFRWFPCGLCMAGRLLAFERSWPPVVGADPRVCPYFGGLSAAWGQAGRHGSLPLRVAVVVSGWCSGLVLWVGVLALAERVFSHHRTPAPPYPRILTTAPPYHRTPEKCYSNPPPCGRDGVGF